MVFESHPPPCYIFTIEKYKGVTHILDAHPPPRHYTIFEWPLKLFKYMQGAAWFFPFIFCRLNLHKKKLFLGVSWKLRGSPPPNVVDTIPSWYLDVRGLLFWIIWQHLFWNQTKIERLMRFQKNLSYPPNIVVKWKISENKRGTEVLF